MMITEAQNAAFRRATLLLTELPNSDELEPLPQGEKTPIRPWHSRDDIGIIIYGGASWLSDRAVEWFRSRGWLAVGMTTDVFIAPFVEETPPEVCYHVTPASNEQSISERGLLRGEDAGRSTSGRRDAGKRIHVCFDVGEAAKWTEDKLLGKCHPGQEWVMFEIEKAGINGKVFRDPASQTGYILEARAVPKEFLRLVRRWPASQAER